MKNTRLEKSAFETISTVPIKIEHFSFKIHTQNPGNRCIAKTQTIATLEKKTRAVEWIEHFPVLERRERLGKRHLEKQVRWPFMLPVTESCALIFINTFFLPLTINPSAQTNPTTCRQGWMGPRPPASADSQKPDGSLHYGLRPGPEILFGVKGF